MKIALTGHTRGLGKLIHEYLISKKYSVIGFSFSTGCDLRDYYQVGSMIDLIKNHDWFINCAHPDYCQAQILYRIFQSEFRGKVLNIGSPVVHYVPEWKDLNLLEYVTQKTALLHAHTTLVKFFSNRTFMWEPEHTKDKKYVSTELEKYGL